MVQCCTQLSVSFISCWRRTAHLQQFGRTFLGGMLGLRERITFYYTAEKKKNWTRLNVAVLLHNRPWSNTSLESSCPEVPSVVLEF